MSSNDIVVQTQYTEIVVQTQRIEVNPATSSVTVINAGPPGPAGIPGAPGIPGDVNMVPVNEAIDTKIATHNQTAPIHEQATSGRDFVAVFENGLI